MGETVEDRYAGVTLADIEVMNHALFMAGNDTSKGWFGKISPREQPDDPKKGYQSLTEEQMQEIAKDTDKKKKFVDGFDKAFGQLVLNDVDKSEKSRIQNEYFNLDRELLNSITQVTKQYSSTDSDNADAHPGTTVVMGTTENLTSRGDYIDDVKSTLKNRLRKIEDIHHSKSQIEEIKLENHALAGAGGFHTENHPYGYQDQEETQLSLAQIANIKDAFENKQHGKYREEIKQYGKLHVLKAIKELEATDGNNMSGPDYLNALHTQLEADKKGVTTTAPDPNQPDPNRTTTPDPNQTMPAPSITGGQAQKIHIQELLAALDYKDNLGYIEDKIKSGSEKDFDGLIKKHTNADIQAFEAKYNADHKGHELPTDGTLTMEQLTKALEETYKAQNPSKSAHDAAEDKLADARKEAHDHPQTATHSTTKPSPSKPAATGGTTPPNSGGSDPLPFDAPHPGDDNLILAIRKDWGESKHFYPQNAHNTTFQDEEVKLVKSIQNDRNVEIVDGKRMTTIDDAIHYIQKHLTPGGEGTGPGNIPGGNSGQQPAR